MPRRLPIIALFTIGLLMFAVSTSMMVARCEPPRSEWLAFVNYSDSDLYLVKTDGTLRRVTTDLVYYPGRPVWSPSQQWLIYPTNRDIKRVRLSNGQSEPVSNTLQASQNAAFHSPALARSGHWLYYVQVTPSSGTEVWRRSITGRTERLTHLFERDWVVVDYALAPDEQRLALNTLDLQHTDDGYDLRVMPGDDTALLTDVHAINSMAWSPDGAWLLVAYQTEAGFTIGRIRLADGQVSPITRFSYRDSNIQAEWSPDGQWVAYNAPCQADLAFVGCLWVASTRDWQPRILYNFGNGQAIYRGYVGVPRWSPDSQTLAFVQPDTQNRGLRSLYLIAAAGGNPTRIALPVLENEFAWAPIIESGNLDGWALVIGLGAIFGAIIGWWRTLN